MRDACLADARAAGLAVQDYSEQVIVFQACDAVRLLQQGLENSGGLGVTDELVAGIEEIGTGLRQRPHARTAPPSSGPTGTTGWS